jgi:hypothetical protein
MEKNMQTYECCPPFDPEPWDDKTIEWKDKIFVKAKVFTIFFMPVNFGKVITKLMKRATDAGVNVENICLSDHTSKWNMDILVAVDKDVPSMKNVRISGSFYCKVYEGNFKETGKWCQDYDERVKSMGKKVGKMYMWYTTCPKCAKKYGKNYTVILSDL